MIQSSPLTYRYPGGTALSFGAVDVPQGAVVLLGGPSGCGKSTWLALLAGLVAPESGSLRVAGQELGGQGSVATDAWRARTIGLLPQRLHLSGALDVADNLALAYWAVGEAPDATRIAATLAALDVADLTRRMPAQLSGGQAQRVALARAVLLQPRVVLADEPTGSLDDGAARAAVELLLQVARLNGATLVIASHDRRVAELLDAGTAGRGGYTALVLPRPAEAAA